MLSKQLQAKHEKINKLENSKQTFNVNTMFKDHLNKAITSYTIRLRQFGSLFAKFTWINMKYLFDT